MKILKLHLLSAVLLLTGSANAQFFKAENPSLDVSGAAGVSCYYGDLVQKAPIFRDPSLCMSIGLAYNYNPHLILRSNTALRRCNFNIFI